MTQALVNYDEMIAQEAAKMKDRIGSRQGGRISLKGKHFSFPDETRTNNPINIIVLDFRNRNALLPPYKPNVKNVPICWASGELKHDKLKPSPNVPKPVNEDCGSCPNMQWGSGSGKGRACKNGVRIAFVAADGKSRYGNDIFTFEVSPTGLREWDGIVAELQANDKIPFNVILEVSFDPERDFPTLKFKNQGYHKRMGELWPLRAKAQEILARDYDPDQDT